MPADEHGYRSRSLWLDTLGDGDDLLPRPSLPRDLTADVAIVGAGYTGLWTALSLLQREPTIRVVVIDKEIAGFGASGRNGGWCSALLPMSLDALARHHGHDAAVAMRRAMEDTVAEVGRTSSAEGIDCHFERGGTIVGATNAAQLDRLRSDVRAAHRFGATDDDVRVLTADEAADHLRSPGWLGASITPHCAALHPARLARGLARAVERRGAAVYERTAATVIEPGIVRTDHGTIRAEVVVRATEGFTPALAGMSRVIIPIYSLMVATEPLPASTWATIGLEQRQTFADARRLIIYGQRTAEGRLAFGGRGAPYHFGSKTDPSFDRNEAVFADLRSTLTNMFPAVAGARFTHAWGGPLGAARDWACSVGLDRSTGMAWAGGYVGDGVATTNLAGRTLADLILGRSTDLTRLPWVGHRSRRWEPEPLRWLAINGLLRIPAGLDRAEARTGRTPRIRGWLLDSALGH